MTAGSRWPQTGDSEASISETGVSQAQEVRDHSWLQGTKAPRQEPAWHIPGGSQNHLDNAGPRLQDQAMGKAGAQLRVCPKHDGSAHAK